MMESSCVNPQTAARREAQVDVPDSIIIQVVRLNSRRGSKSIPLGLAVPLQDRLQDISLTRIDYEGARMAKRLDTSRHFQGALPTHQIDRVKQLAKRTQIEDYVI